MPTEPTVWIRMAPGLLQHASGVVQITLGRLIVAVTGIIPAGVETERPVFYLHARGKLASQYDRLADAKAAGIVLVSELTEID